jgi:mono/diheme cytochrome c family protein
MSGITSPTWCIATAAACLAGVSACHQVASREVEPVPVTVVVAQPDTVSEQDVVTEGRKIFHGHGLCYACHGGRLQGGPVAPPLVGAGRDLSDTSFAYILHVVRAGAPHTPMVADQGGISDGEALQVANYVWAVSNGKVVP